MLSYPALVLLASSFVTLLLPGELLKIEQKSRGNLQTSNAYGLCYWAVFY